MDMDTDKSVPSPVQSTAGFVATCFYLQAGDGRGLGKFFTSLRRTPRGNQRGKCGNPTRHGQDRNPRTCEKEHPERNAIRHWESRIIHGTGLIMKANRSCDEI
ncbi:unnamed protein product [Amoebophrya sp. A25]|nr:unnamed protein product [Amoebophrya sp. A25]|eukprot:GSA25T00018671001.1